MDFPFPTAFGEEKIKEGVAEALASQTKEEKTPRLAESARALYLKTWDEKTRQGREHGKTLHSLL